MAAHVAVFGLVLAQSEFDKTHSALPGVAAQRPAGSWLPAEAARHGQVRLKLDTEIRNVECNVMTATSCTRGLLLVGPECMTHDFLKLEKLVVHIKEIMMPLNCQ